MAKENINKYIEKRYKSWREYSTYQCTKAGIGHLADDLLQEVIVMLLAKDETTVSDMLDRKRGIYCELDFFVLKMIKVNAHSVTSPVRYKEQAHVS